jgi:DNA-binding Lrp family transcriptional regulator
LTALDLNILLHLLSFWWEDENLPHPSKETLAKAIGVTASTVQRRVRAMEGGGLLRRIERRKANDRSETNLYDLAPLRSILEPHAELELKERKASQKARHDRMTKVTKA